MTHDVFADLLARFPGSRVRRTPYGPLIELATDGARVELVMRAVPQGAATPTGQPLLLAASVPPLQGFAMRLVPSNRILGVFENDSELPRTMRRLAAKVVFEDLLQETNDPSLAALWCDPPIRQALTATLGLVCYHAPGYVQVHVVGAAAEVVGAEARIAPGLMEPAHVAACARALALLASRPQRLAEEMPDVMRPIGAIATGTWGLGDEHASFVTTRQTPITIFHFRAVPGERADHARLRTRIAATRIGGADRFHVRAGAIVEASDRARLERRLEPHARLIAQVAELWSPGDEVVATLDGFVRDPARLTAAIDLVAALSVERVDGIGPYR